MKYKAFISYRHLEPDKTVAIELQKLLERVKVSKGEQSWRVFRDESELPTSSNLSDDIDAALRESEYLIVICSEALKESIWCLKEIETFKSLHNDTTDNIFTILVSGTPGEAFPESLCHTKKEMIVDGVSKIVEVEVEPLAANVTADNVALMKKKLKTEYLRIAAPMLGVSFDQLYDRKKRSKTNRIIAIGTAAATVITVASVVFAIYNSKMTARINEQLKLTEIENKKYLEQLELTEQEKEKFENQLEQTRIENARNYNIQAESYMETNKHRDAVETIVKAFEMNDNHEPLFAESNLILADQIGAYEKRKNFPYLRITHDENVRGVWLLADGKRLVTADAGNHAYIWDTATGECLWKSEDKISYGDVIVNNHRLVKKTDGIENTAINSVLAKLSYTSESFLRTGFVRSNPENDSFLNDDFFIYKTDSGIKRVNVIDCSIDEEISEGAGSYIKTGKDGFSTILENRYSNLERVPDEILIYDSKNGNATVAEIPDNLDLTGSKLIGTVGERIFVTDKEDNVRYYTFDGNNFSEISEAIIANANGIFVSHYVYDLDNYIVIETRNSGLIDVEYSKLTFFDANTLQKKWEYDVKVMGSKMYDVGILEKGYIKDDSDVIYYVFSNKIIFIDSETGKLLAESVFDDGIIDYYHTNKGAFWVTLKNGRTEVVVYELNEEKTVVYLIEDNMPEISYHAYLTGVEALGYGNSKDVDLYKNVDNEDYNLFFEKECSDENKYANAIDKIIMIDDYNKAIIAARKYGVFIYDFDTGEEKIIESFPKEEIENNSYSEMYLQGDNLFVLKSRDDFYTVYDINTGEIISKDKIKEDYSMIFPKKSAFAIKSFNDTSDSGESGLLFYDGRDEERVVIGNDRIINGTIYSSTDGNIVMFVDHGLVTVDAAALLDINNFNPEYMCNINLYNKSKDFVYCSISEIPKDEAYSINRVSINEDGSKVGFTYTDDYYKFALIDADKGEINYVDTDGKHITDLFLGQNNVYAFANTGEICVYDYYGIEIGSIDISFGLTGALNASNTEIEQIDENIITYKYSDTLWVIDTERNECIYKLKAEEYDPIHKRFICEQDGALFSYPAYSSAELYDKAIGMLNIQ